MSDETKPTLQMPELEPGVRYYLFIGCSGLLVLWLGLVEKGYGLFALVPTLLGALGLAPHLTPANWPAIGHMAKRLPSFAMPPLILLVLVALELFFGYSPWRSKEFLLVADVLTCAGLLAYFLGQYRLYSLRGNVVPPDPRVRPDRSSGDEPETRPAVWFHPRELRWPAVVLPLALVSGQLLWQWVRASGEWDLDDAPPFQLGMRDTAWRMFSLLWFLGVGALLLTGLGTILRLYRFSGAEARQLGRDILWTETRGEQRRINRWLAWMRRQRARKTGELP